jgi:predicted DNA-binding transcriptional regulator AlpA
MSPETNTERADRLRSTIGLLTEADLMLLLGVSEHTLQAWRSNGEGPRFVKLGRGVMYRVVDVNAWINASVQTGTPAGIGGRAA